MSTPAASASPPLIPPPPLAVRRARAASFAALRAARRARRSSLVSGSTCRQGSGECFRRQSLAVLPYWHPPPCFLYCRAQGSQALPHPSKIPAIFHLRNTCQGVTAGLAYGAAYLAIAVGCTALFQTGCLPRQLRQPASRQCVPTSLAQSADDTPGPRATVEVAGMACTHQGWHCMCSWAFSHSVRTKSIHHRRNRNTIKSPTSQKWAVFKFAHRDDEYADC